LPLATAVLVATALYFLLTVRKTAAGDYPAAHDVGETNECLIEVAYLLLALQVWWPRRAAGPLSAWAIAVIVVALVALPGVPLVVALVRSALEPEPMLRAVAEMRAGDARQRAGDDQGAIARYRESLVIVPNQVALHFRLAGVYLRQNQTTEAAREFESVLRLDPRNAESHARLGAIYLQDGLLPEAAAHLSTAVEFAPQFAAAHYYLGLVRLGQRQPAEAAACFREALRLQPGFPPAQEELAKLAAEGL
jgi:tetratricopeptide (TPR) repeat protein